MPETESKSRAGSSKSKGSEFEREVSSKLSLWFSDGERDDIFYRSHSSGGRFTRRNKSSKNTAYQSGDITCSDPCGKNLIDAWSIECKTGYGKWDVLDLLDSNQKVTQLEQFFKQCREDALECNKEPVLIFRRSQRKICICIKSDYFYSLTEWFGAPEVPIIKISPSSLVIIRLSDFLLWANSEHFK